MSNSNVFNSITEVIGNTPLVKINRLNTTKATVYAKLEYLNPGGSVKDRIGKQILEDAVEQGLLKPGATIIEATAGNTGVGLVMAGVEAGYRYMFVMPDKMSEEKRNFLRSFGAEIVIVPSAVPPHHPEYYTNKAKSLAEEIPGAFFANQFYNQSNPTAHYTTTGPELWEQTDGKITHFVCGMGTGGTMSGVGRYLKEKNPNIKIIGADPFGSIIKTFKESGKVTEGSSYLVEGIGGDKIPDTLHIDYLDEVYNVTDKESFTVARQLAIEEGMFCGGSTGTLCKVALDVAEKLDENAVVVFLACDHGDRYYSKLYNDDWMRENQFLSLEDITVARLIDKKRELFKELIYINSDSSVEDAFKLMNENGITQLPVMDDRQQVGSIDENDIMKMMLTKKDSESSLIKDVMKKPFPVVQSTQNIVILKDLLKKHPTVMVEKQGQMIGLLTRADIIEFTL